MTYLLLGRRRRGKTTLAWYMARKAPRRVVFDPRGIIRDSTLTVVNTADDFRDAVDELREGEIPVPAGVVYTPMEPFKRSWAEFCEAMREWVADSPKLDVAFVVDELSFVCRPGVPLDEDFEWCLKTCDTNHVDFFLTCHRPNNVPTEIRAIADFWYVFRVTQEHDLTVLRERFQADGVEIVKGLQGFQCLRWDDGAGAFDRVDDSDSWHVSLTG